VLIDKIELEPYSGKVYNISVDNVKNYFAENVLVHNVALKKT
jgi:intein/homing endonuclease